MGKGDIKTRRGKITNRSFGKRRPRKQKANVVVAKAVAKAEAAAPEKKVAVKKTKKAKEE